MANTATPTQTESRVIPTPPKFKTVDRTEVRSYKTAIKRMGDGEENRNVGGLASVYNSPTWMGWYWETVEAGFFDDALPISDIRALFNHDPNLVLARRKPDGSGTLKVELKEEGFDYEFEAPPTTAGNDLVINLSLGNVDESSFAFTTKEERWEEIKNDDGTWEFHRYLVKADEIFDVSPTTYGAYKSTSSGLRTDVAKRSFESWKTKNQPPETKNMDARTLGAIIAEMELA